MDQMLLVSAPDDVALEGVRLLIVGLTPEQSNIVSTVLTTIETAPRVIVYVWNEHDSVDWLTDKIYKSQLILFNAEFENQTLVGYLAGKLNSYYFGSLKSINQINNSMIFDENQCRTILTNLFKKYEIQ